LDRAWRLTPRDPTVALALATACLGHNDRRAEALFAGIVAEHDVREAWLGLATARRRLGRTCGAAEALAEVRRRYVVGENAAAVAEANRIPKPSFLLPSTAKALRRLGTCAGMHPARSHVV
jgi:predicted Zn-dependent protease